MTPEQISQQRNNVITAIISNEIGANRRQVEAAIGLIDDGATIPFIARYRKEATSGLDDGQLRLLSERLDYLRELEERRQTILASIASQGKLTSDLETAIEKAGTKAELEDLYLPFKPKRRTRAQIARENGLGPLSDLILAERRQKPDFLAQNFLNEKIPDIETALTGARDILAEMIAENAELIGNLRRYMHQHGFLCAKLMKGKEEAGAKFSDYFNHREKWATTPSHRALAMLRGRNEEILSLDIEVENGEPPALQPIYDIMAKQYSVGSDLPGDIFLATVFQWTWRIKLSTQLTLELLHDLRERADKEAIDVFARNLRNLLLAAPAGAKTTLGLDPGIRTGVKTAVIDATGKVLETTTIYPYPPKNDVEGAKRILLDLIKRHKIELIAIGNGTGSRETEKLVQNILTTIPEPRPIKVIVSEAGASVYSASALAAAELPNLDVSLRGAVSIARRLQDPLAELVKIEPKSIGVGQYQHDVDQNQLSRSLDGVVEDAVNAVGVDLNTASPSLLSHISGLSHSLAEAIVHYRDTNGAFKNRKELLLVPRFGEKTFEQSAGFLRIRAGTEPLDASSVHPEAYAVARKIIAASGSDLIHLMGNNAALKKLKPTDFITDRFGLPTILDIISELEKPGRDPRPAFKTALFADNINDITDLKPGMELEGTVTNVAAFGAFIDIGVHQDGLVHISQLANKFVRDPHEVIKVGEVVKVKVQEVDFARKRISLTMRRDTEATVPTKKPHAHSAKEPQTGFAEQLAAALKKKK